MELQTLLDERAIYLKICDLAEAMDQRDWHALDQILLNDATGDYGLEQPIVGREGFRELFKYFLSNCGPTQHLIGNVRVTINGDSAESRCYVRDIHMGKGEREQLFLSCSGQYVDQWRRTQEGWRLSHRTKTTPIVTGTFEALGLDR